MWILLFFALQTAHSAELTNDQWQELRKNIETLPCEDLPGWQKHLEFFAAEGYRYLLTDPARSRCFKSWTPAQRDCFNNMLKYAESREMFGKAGNKQQELLGEKAFDRLTDLSDLFPCKTPEGVKANVKVCSPPAGWPEQFLNCIRSKSKAPECKKVAGWCAVRMNRQHEGLMDTKDSIVFYDPKRSRFIINFEARGARREHVIDTFTVVKPKKAGEPWQSVFASFGYGLMQTPNNHSSGEGCWHCHPAGAPRKMEPLWGSVSAADKEGMDCINNAIGKMGDFSAEHLWPGASFGPHRGQGSTVQSCDQCHSGDLSQNHSYSQRGRLFHNAQMTREMFAKMTSWSGGMPPGQYSKIEGFDKYREILDRIFKVPEERRKEAFDTYVEAYDRHTKGDDRLEFPDRDLKKAARLLEGRRLAQGEALRKMGASEAEVDLVTRVSKQIDETGLRAFGEITQLDKERLKLWLSGGKNQCLTAPAPAASGENSTVR